MIGFNKIHNGFIHRAPNPKGKSSKLIANQRRDKLVSFVSESAATSLALSEHLGVTSNTIVNDIRVLIAAKRIVNVNPCAGKYLVKAA